jgi:hypothetical protein
MHKSTDLPSLLHRYQEADHILVLACLQLCTIQAPDERYQGIAHSNYMCFG